MPVLIPIVVAGAAYFGSAAVVTAIGLAAGSLAAAVVGVVVGAVIGAAVGAVGAAMTGGDIGKGALWGAVGGAVAGGFGGYGAGASDGGASSSVNNSSLDAMNGMGAEAGSSTASMTASATETTGMTAGEGTMWGQGISTAGEMVAGYAQGEAGEESNADAMAADEKRREEEFEQRMKEINQNHQNSLSTIQAQSDNSLALADKNNAASKDQLNTRIGADKDTVTAANAEQDAKIAGFNESIRGTDENLFTRPTFNFNPGEEGDVAFSSGFDERAGNSENLSPEEIAVIQEQQEAVA